MLTISYVGSSVGSFIRSFHKVMITMSKQFWLDFEKFVNGKIPACIKKILSETGFDTDICLESINSESIKEIENHVNKRKDILKETVYENASSSACFEFLPGHKILLLSLPERIKQFKQEKERKKGTTVKSPLKSDLLLKKAVVDKLKATVSSLETPEHVPLSITCVLDFVKENNTCKCKIKCPFCTKKFSALYKQNYWSTSNFKRHWTLDHHFKNANLDANSCASSNQTSNQNLTLNAGHVNQSKSKSDNNITLDITPSITQAVPSTLASTSQQVSQTISPSISQTTVQRLDDVTRMDVEKIIGEEYYEFFTEESLEEYTDEDLHEPRDEHELLDESMDD